MLNVWFHRCTSYVVMRFTSIITLAACWHLAVLTAWLITHQIRRCCLQKCYLSPMKQVNYVLKVFSRSLCNFDLQFFKKTTNSFTRLKRYFSYNNNNNTLFQRFSVLEQRFNAVLLHDSLPDRDFTDYLTYLTFVVIFLLIFKPP